VCVCVCVCVCVRARARALTSWRNFIDVNEISLTKTKTLYIVQFAL